MIRTHTITGRASTVYRGLSLVEMVIAIPLVGLVLVGVLSLVGASKSAQLKASLGRQGHLVAQQLMSEILRQDYADPTIAQTTRDDILSTGTSTYTLGRDAVTGRDETAGSDRSLFNDVDDYDMWVAGPPEAKDGTVFADLQGWSRFSMVSWSTSTQIDANGQDDVGLKTIRVNVKYNGVMVASLTAVKSIGLAWLEACCFGDGSCALLRAEACAAQGGTAQGPDTTCVTTECTTGSTVLFVTGGSCVIQQGQSEPTCSATVGEQERIKLIESWGYGVTLISAMATQGEFDTATGAADVVYVSGAADETALGTKLRAAAIGVVSEAGDSADELGLGDNPATNDYSRISVLDNTHYITEGFSTGWLGIIPTNQPLQALMGGIATGANELAQVWISSANYDPGLVALERGAAQFGGGTAAARRVALPWGGSTFDASALNANGQDVMRRSLEWAAEAPKHMLFVGQGSSPTTSEAARIALIESWGYQVTLIPASATQEAFDTALAGVDVAYIAESAPSEEIGTKLTATTVGVVNEQVLIVQDLELTSANPVAITVTDASITDNTHYITAPFSVGVLTLSSPWQPFYYVNSGVAVGVQELATVFNKPSLLIAEAGSELVGGGSAPGRRVQLPWGSAGFDFSALNADGQTIMRRAIEWATGPDGACGDGNCTGGETACTCPADCGAPAGSEDISTTCDDGLDNDCDTKTDCDDIDCLGAAACSATVCGNGTCESGEDCDSCSADCPAVRNGKATNRYCCGNGIAEAAEGDGSICDGNY